MLVADKVEHNIDLNELAEVYVRIRKEREFLKAEYEGKDGALVKDLEDLERLMLSACNEINADSIKTSHGTIIRSLKETYVCADWDNLKKFIIEQKAPELLQQRIHQSNFKEFMSQHEGEGLPPGVSSMREYTIIVRKPTTK